MKKKLAKTFGKITLRVLLGHIHGMQEALKQDIAGVRTEVKQDIARLEMKIDRLESKVDHGFARVETQIDNIDKRLDQVEIIPSVSKHLTHRS